MDYLSDDITAALRADQPKTRGRRLTVRTEDGTFPILKLLPDGLQVAEAVAPRLRGYVDIMDDDERLSRCLVVRGASEFGVTTYEFKRRTADTGAAPAQHAIPDGAPVALLT